MSHCCVILALITGQGFVQGPYAGSTRNIPRYEQRYVRMVVQVGVGGDDDNHVQ